MSQGVLGPRTFSRRKLLGTLGVLTLSSVVAACTQPASPAPTAQPKTEAAQSTAAAAKPTAAAKAEPTAQSAPKPAAASGDVLWWGLVEYDFEAHSQDLLDTYKQYSPNVNLKLEILPEESYVEKITPALASGGGPDVFVGAFIPVLQRPGVALELSSYLMADGVDLSEWNADAFKIQSPDPGKYYGMPRDLFGGEGWFYNKELFDQAGVPYPQYGWTWNDALEVIPKLSDKANRLYGFVVTSPLPAEDFGFAPVSADGKQVLGHFDSPLAIESFEIWRTLYDYSPTIDQQTTEFQDATGGGAGPVGAFLSKRAALAKVDVGVRPQIDQAGISWGYVNTPWPNDPENRHRPSLSYVIWSINKNTKNPDGSWNFLKWLTAKDGGATILAHAGYFVPFRESLEAANYPQEILDVRFADLPADWKAPNPRIYSVPCFREAGLDEWTAATEKVLISPPDQIESIVREAAQRGQQAEDACWAKTTG